MVDSHSPPSPRDRRTTFLAAFLGWLCAGLVMGLGPLAARPAVRDLLFREHGEIVASLTAAQEGQIGLWFARYTSAFLLGGALGGVLFGRLGDRRGRVTAMGWSILCYSLFTGASWFVATPEQLLGLRFLASLGVGGMWPAGVALLAEAWPAASRPMVAGLMGMAANLGILLMALMGMALAVTPDSWRLVVLIGTLPALLGLWVLARTPESTHWIAERTQSTKPAQPLLEVLRPPLLYKTLIGVLLGTIPLVGTWASGKWMIPWADARGASSAVTQAIWAVGAVLGSAAGGWLANRLGRRTTYFTVSAATLVINLSIYRWLEPGAALFLPAVFALGLIATIFFGWLPLYLPELFPTRVRATGSGVTYNVGRVASAAGVLWSGELMRQFAGDYARVGEVSAWVYGLGMIAILFAPDTTKSADKQ